ncbi:hypothetical protein [Aquipuribacter sp. MA13-6]|uniref:hypothetical protein n=1 Tax=unclassified Aquipuribacter TaxID=2635084 RepID=UPI003EEF94AA
MIVIGIILVLLGLVLGAFVVGGSLPGDTGTDVSFSLFGLTVETSVVVVFALGALTLLLLELGVIALRSGARKSSKRRAELQRLRRVEAEVQSRQAAESQRNATPASAAPSAAPAPFARRDPDSSPRPGSASPAGSSAPSGQSTSSGPSTSTSQSAPAGSSADRSDLSSAQGDQSHPTAPASTRPPEDASSTSTLGDTGSQPRTDGPSSTDRP